MKCNLRKIRKEAKISQEELSKKSNVSRSIISGLESGRTIVTTTGTLTKLASALEKNVSDFFS